MQQAGCARWGALSRTSILRCLRQEGRTGEESHGKGDRWTKEGGKKESDRKGELDSAEKRKREEEGIRLVKTYMGAVCTRTVVGRNTSGMALFGKGARWAVKPEQLISLKDTLIFVCLFF